MEIVRDDSDDSPSRIVFVIMIVDFNRSVKGDEQCSQEHGSLHSSRSVDSLDFLLI